MNLDPERKRRNLDPREKKDLSEFCANILQFSGLWVKETEWREQADIRFKHEVLFIADTSLGPLVWSTNPAFNTLMATHLRPPLIKVILLLFSAKLLRNFNLADSLQPIFIGFS